MWLKEKGAQVFFNTSYNPVMDKDYDVVIRTTGESYSSDFMKANYGLSIAPNGQIFVNDYMQVA